MTPSREPRLPEGNPWRLAPRFRSLIAISLLAHPWLSGADMLRKHTLTSPISQPIDIDIRVVESEGHQIRATKKSEGLWWLAGGLIGYAIASNSNKTKAKQANQIENELAELLNGLDCQGVLLNRYEGGLNPSILPILGEVRFTQVKAGMDAPAPSPWRSPEMLSVQYSYAMQEDLTALQVTMKAVVWKHEVLTPMDSMVDDQIKSQAKYFQVFTYEIAPEEAPASKDPMQLASAWVAMGRDQVSSRILSGMTTLADALAYDLGCLDLDNESKGSAPAGSQAGEVADRLILEADHQRWMRSSSGEITILEMK